MAILALVFAFVFSPLGIVFGIIGLRQVRERREGGRGLAMAGLVLGVIFTLLSILALVALLVAAKSVSDSVESSVSRAPSASSSPPSPSSSARPSASPSAPATGSTTVAAACRSVLPQVTGLAQELQGKSSPQEVGDVFLATADRLDGLARTNDPSFNADVRALADEYRDAGSQAANGEPPGNEQDLFNAAREVGRDCGLAGVTTGA
jgi:hypothetical protein